MMMVGLLLALLALGVGASHSSEPRAPRSSTVVVERARSHHVASAASPRHVVPYQRQRQTPVTNFLLCANGAAFVALFRRDAVFRALAKNDLMIRRSTVQSYRLVSSCFLHANVAHLLVNCNSLNALGRCVEPWFGSRRTATVYGAAGLAGNLLSLRLATAPLSVGASGCIFGLLGAWAVFLQTNREFFAARGFDVGGSLRSMLESCAFTAAIGLAPGSMIDNAGHLGGLLGGAAAAFVVGPRLRRTAYGFVVDEPRVLLPGSGKRARASSTKVPSGLLR